MKKRIVLVLVILIPSLIYFLFELSEANFTKMAFYGPRYFSNETNDTVYHDISRLPVYSSHGLTQPANFDGQVLAVAILSPENKTDNYKMRGLIEYATMKQNYIAPVEVRILVPVDDTATVCNYADSLHLTLDNIKFWYFKSSQLAFIRDSVLFNRKPYYVMPHFFALIDNKKHIRGYYDGNFVAEIKRLITEYQHLRLRDEHVKMESGDKIEKK